MSFDDRLTHTVAILRTYSTGMLNELGQPVTFEDTAATVPAAIQPRSVLEAPTIAQAGPEASTHTIFLRPLDLTTADAILHDPAVCGAVNDLPLGRYEVVGVPYAAGLGHHLEVEARLIAAPEYAVAGS